MIYSGIAVGAVLTMMHIGNVALPPLGNSLATISAGAPFFLWAAFSALALVTLTFIRGTGRRETTISKNEQDTHL